MATALDIITNAATLVGALGTGEVLNAAESAYGLTALNDMLDSWGQDRQLIYRVATYQYTWPSVTISQTIGIGGDINIERPVAIADSYVNQPNNQSYVVQVITKTGYDAIGLKTLQTNIPEWIYYDPSFPLGTIYLYPVPSAAIPLFLSYWIVLPEFATLTDTVELPRGYKRALEFNLAVDLAPYFQMPVPPAVGAMAAQSAYKLKRMNSKAAKIPAQLEVAYNPSHYSFNIFRGY